MQTKYIHYKAADGSEQRAVVDTCDSVSDFGANLLAENPPWDNKDWTRKMESWSDHRRRTGTTMVADMKSGGTAANVREMRSMTVGHIPDVPPTAARQVGANVVGVPCVPALMSGVPTWAVMPTEQPALGPVRVFVPSITSCGVSSEDAAIRWATLGRYLDVIAATRPVELYAVAGCEAYPVFPGERALKGGGRYGRKPHGKRALYLCTIRVPLPASEASLAALAVYANAWDRAGILRGRSVVLGNSPGNVDWFKSGSYGESVWSGQDSSNVHALKSLGFPIGDDQDAIYVPTLRGYESEDQRALAACFERFLSETDVA